ncbi:MAG: polysaccharide deacetylase family protein [Clostridia bacterium]|nr:polysaccharide deacetylase family protein [Clostridia bacterium]
MTRKKKRTINHVIHTLVLISVAVGAVLLAFYFSGAQGWFDPPQGTDTSGVHGSTVSVSDTEIRSSETDVTDTDVTDTEKLSESTSSDGNTTDVVTDETSSDGSSTATDTNVTDTESTDSTSKATTDKETNTKPTSTHVSKPTDGIKRIAFTFDDGPYYKITTKIADEFAKYGGKCTFFVVGDRISWNKDALSYVKNLGNEVGIHGYTHEVYFNKCSDSEYQKELSKTAAAIIKEIETAPVLLRPPGGSITKSRVQECPYSVILWNVDSLDWKYKSTGSSKQKNIDTIVDRIMSKVTNGDIILMHDLYSNTLEAVKIVLPLLKEQGYEFVTVSELLGEDLAPGYKYSNAY